MPLRISDDLDDVMEHMYAQSNGKILKRIVKVDWKNNR